MSNNNIKKRRSTGWITLKEVAEHAGVSAITASRALRGERKVSSELAQRVKAAAQLLGYVPDPAARALASSRSSSIAVVVPMLTNGVFVELIEAIHEVLFPAGFQALIGMSHYDADQEENLIRTYLAYRPAGFLLTGFDRTEASKQLLQASRLPCVYMMETSTQPGLNCVGLSQAQAGADMTRHLLAQGCRKIVLAAAQLDPRTLQRIEGYRGVMRERGIYDPQLEFFRPERSSVSLGAAMLEQIHNTVPGVDAIFFNNDDLAQGAIYAANQLGISVPQQIAIAGFNDLPGSAQMVPALTTVKTPRGLIGQHAAEMMLKLLSKNSSVDTAIDVGFELMIRASTLKTALPNSR